MIQRHDFHPKLSIVLQIRYLYLKGKTGKEIHGGLADVYGSSAASYAQVKFWVGEFKRKRRYYVGLLTQEKYNKWSALCKLARPAENHHP